MIDVLLARFQQGHRTYPYPNKAPVLPERYQGCPSIDTSRCAKGCRACVDSCPTDAIAERGGKLSIDLGQCLFCTDCRDACPSGAIEATRIYQLATRKREELVTSGRATPRVPAADDAIARAFGRSLKLRQVSAAGCNACEADVNVLGTLAFDLGRFGIQFVASPRHADGLLITGPVSKNMELGLMKTYEAVPSPKIVVVVGACAISGGPFRGHPEVHDGATGLLPVDLFVPGCPPHPYTILEGLLAILDRLPTAARDRAITRENQRSAL